MKRITFNQPIRINTEGGYKATVQAQVPYILTDAHADHRIPADVCSDRIRYRDYKPYDGNSLRKQSLLLHWLAGLADTVTLAPALLSLQKLNPEARKSVTARLDFLREQGSDLVERISSELQETLEMGGLSVWVSCNNNSNC